MGVLWISFRHSLLRVLHRGIRRIVQCRVGRFTRHRQASIGVFPITVIAQVSVLAGAVPSAPAKFLTRHPLQGAVWYRADTKWYLLLPQHLHEQRYHMVSPGVTSHVSIHSPQ